MVPTIICDKSAIQSFSFNEIFFLHKYFNVNVPIVLINETLADLEKNRPGRSADNEAIQLARKLVHFSSFVNVDYQELIRDNLLGKKIKMDGRPLVPAYVNGTTNEGKKIVVVEESIHEKSLRRWVVGKFTDEERMRAKMWREKIAQLDFQPVKTFWRDKGFVKIDSPEQMNDKFNELERLIKSEDLLNAFMVDFDIPTKFTDRIISRWKAEEAPSFKEFAPYAYYCFKTKLIFHLALLNEFVSSSRTVAVDLQYLYYLPFCVGFTSGDSFHKTLVPHLKRENQIFCDGETLRAELQTIRQIWASIPEGGRIDEWKRRFGDRPPTGLSCIGRLWDILLSQQFDDPEEDEIEKLLHKRNLNMEEWCPCQSGLKYCDCHGKFAIS